MKTFLTEYKSLKNGKKYGGKVEANSWEEAEIEAFKTWPEDATCPEVIGELVSEVILSEN